MQQQSSSLNDVVVIGYGSRRRKDVTGAISTVTDKDIEKSTSMTPELALQGKAAGVFIESGGGEPGARPTIRIRGVNTCLLYTSPSPRDGLLSRMPSSA